MPIPGIGIIAGGPAGTEEQAFTRRAFTGKLIVQTRNATPLTAAMFANAKPAGGGMSSVTVPMQGGSYVQTAASDASGKFPQPPALNPGVDAEWNLKIIVTPIPFLGPEGLVQWNAAVVPILGARMNDAGNSQAEYYSTQMWTNATYGTNDMDGLPLIASATGTYAGLSRSANTWLQANIIHAGNVNPTRALLNQYITSAAKFNQGEPPDFGITGPGTWSLLAKDYLGLEQFTIPPGTGAMNNRPSAFNALMVGSVPIYYDPAYGTEGTIYLMKGKYTSPYLHRAAAFAFTGFQSTLANYQLGYVGALVTVAELVCVKPKSVTKIDQLNFDSV